MLSCKNFSGKRGDRQIFSGVSFDVVDGELLVITGPNGAWKSTLLHAIAGVGVGGDETDNGNIVVKGEIFDGQGSLRGLSADERFRRGVMLVFQEPPALPGVSFLTVVREMLFAKTGERVEIAKMYQDIRVVFQRIGVDESFIERSLFDGFSGGEKKRAELALLLLARPRILLLDEIDAGLDANGRKIAQEIIGELLQEGTSVFCVTHNPEFLSGLPVSETFSFSV
ncbi:MAG: ATP-binding cassette domain-containing protein [Patescibacteria group bacterium]